MKGTEKNRDYAKGILYIAAFAIPVITMLFLFRAQDFFPFGDKSLFMMDMRDQYLEFFASLRYMFSGDDSVFFSWSRSMGGNYLGLFAYYVASPLSWITVFFSLKNLTSAIVLLTLLKIGLCGLSFAVFSQYLWQRSFLEASQRKAARSVRPGKNRRKKKAAQKQNVAESQDAENKKTDWRKLLLLPFAVCYALISYNMMYSMCLMWMDGVILLPMVLLGVEKILDGKKGAHYVIALAATFICNYYTGYMVGVFTGIYMIFRVLCQVGSKSVKEYAVKVFRFALGTVFAFGISAPLILPVVKDLTQGKLAANAYIPDYTTNFEFKALLGKFANGTYDSITNSGLPSVYCSWLCVALAVVFLFIRRISWKEKVGAIIINAILCFSFYNTKLDMAWHGFRYPMWFPYRYAFVFSFFIIYLAVRTICTIVTEWDSTQKFLFFHGQTNKKLTDVLNKKALWTGLGVALTIVVSVEMNRNGQAIFEGLNGEFPYYLVTEYEKAIDKTQPLIEEIQKEDKGLYRINQCYEFSKNDAMLYGYHGMTHYSSTFNEGINAIALKLGLAQASNWNSGYGSNPMLDSLFAINYVLDDSKVPAEYTLLSQDESGSVVYKNENALPIAFSAPAAGLSPELVGDVYQNQNDFLNTIAGTQKSFFTNYEFTQEQSGSNYTYTFTAASSNPVYLYLYSNDIAWADVYVNDEFVGNYFSTETKCSLFLGNFSEGQQVTVQVVPSSQVTVDYVAISELHMEDLTETLNELREKGMEITDHGRGKLSGKIAVAEGETIITSIPYEEGWTVKIDGKKVETVSYADAFLAVEAGAGEHEITFSYMSPGFFPGGILLFVLALAGFVVYLRFDRIGRKREDNGNNK